MSPLTKALTIIVTVLSCVLVALVVPFVAKTENMTSTNQELNARLRGAEAAERSAASLTAALRSERDQLVRGSTEQLRQLEISIESLTGENAQNIQRAAEANALVQRLEAQLANAQVTTASLVETADTGAEQKASLTEQVAELSRQNSQLAAALDQARAESERAIDQLNYYKEQLVEAQANGAGGTPRLASSSSNAVRGAVTQVRQENGLVFVEVNIGTSDGLANGAELIIARDEFVGFVTLDRVDNTRSVGRVTDMNMLPINGDIVLVSEI